MRRVAFVIFLLVVCTRTGDSLPQDNLRVPEVLIDNVATINLQVEGGGGQ